MAADRMAAERLALATDPLVRLQMAGINPEVCIDTCQHIIILMTTLCRSPPTPTPTFTCILMQQRPCR